MRGFTEFVRVALPRSQDLGFADCTVPPDDVVERFLDICDRETGKPCYIIVLSRFML